MTVIVLDATHGGILISNALVENNLFGEDNIVFISIYDKDGELVTKTLLTFEGGREAAMKNGYEHFMLKEIYEQPKVIMDTIREYINDAIEKHSSNNAFIIKLKKGVNTLTIFDLAGNQSLTYEILYSPRFFQDTQLLLIVFGSLASTFICIIIFIVFKLVSN